MEDSAHCHHYKRVAVMTVIFSLANRLRYVPTTKQLFLSRDLWHPIPVIGKGAEQLRVHAFSQKALF